MTTSRYLFARIAQAFGYFRKGQRMADAASEMHLLREAEAYLGAAIWQNVEAIEALSVEYWNLRKLVKERDEVRTRLLACQEKLDRAHQERANLLNSTPEISDELLEDRARLMVELEELAVKRDTIVHEAREIRRSYVGMKTKIEVLVEEGAAKDPARAEEIASIKGRLIELKGRFDELKQKRLEVGRLVEEGDAKLDAIDDKLREQRLARREKASEAFHVIGEGNKEISLLRAESGVIDTRMRQLHAEIGRYVSRNAARDSLCSAAANSHRGMVDVMRALRRSIALNHRLAGTA